MERAASICPSGCESEGRPGKLMLTASVWEPEREETEWALSFEGQSWKKQEQTLKMMFTLAGVKDGECDGG